MIQRLFPIDLPENSWQQFCAAGYLDPACGVIYRLDRPPALTARRPDPMAPRWNRPNGMPLGGIDTGCVDLEKNGSLGYMTMFNSHVPRRGPLDLPYLGISVGVKTWILADIDRYHVSSIGWDTVFYFAPERRTEAGSVSWTPEEYFRREDWQVRGVKQVHYWGHYPIADMEFELTELTGPRGPDGIGYTGTAGRPAPLTVGVRAWTPFIPGCMEDSTVPAALFEAHVRNVSASVQRGAVAFTFPGPAREESEGSYIYPHQPVSGKVHGVHITNGGDIGYVLGVLEPGVRTGGELGTDGAAWAQIATALPPVAEGQPGSSVAVNFELGPGEERTVRFLLAWYSPHWRGGGTLTAGGNTYRHMYATRFANALEAAEYLAAHHESLLQRVLRWQAAVYGAEELPVWLRESLVNILHLIAEDGMWAAAEPPVGDWCRPEDGLFGMNECPRDCPWMETLPCDFYGNFPLVFFFPKLALSTLRGFKAYQNPDGGLSLTFTRTPTIELAQDYFDKYQCSTNGLCYTDLIDRLWQVTGDDHIVQEFYSSVKANMIFTMGLNQGPDGVISVPDGDVNQGQGFIRPLPPGKGLKFGGEHNGVFGMSSHLGGMHLAQLRQVERMARHVGDEEFARQCRTWLTQGSGSLESKLWAGDYYLNYWEPETSHKSDLIYAYHLVGEWMARLHGLPGVFEPGRLAKALDTIAHKNVALTKFGAAMFARPDTSAEDRSFEAFYGAYSMFPSETILLAANFMYGGNVELGVEIARRHWENLVCRQGCSWQMPNILRGDMDTGERSFGSDYYQDMIVWMLPAAMQRQDLAWLCREGGLIDRVVRAGMSDQENDIGSTGAADHSPMTTLGQRES